MGVMAIISMAYPGLESNSMSLKACGENGNKLRKANTAKAAKAASENGWLKCQLKSAK